MMHFPNANAGSKSITDPDLLAIAERVHTACLTIACSSSGAPHGHFSLWPKYRHSWWDDGNEDSQLADADIARRFLAPVRFVPSAREIDDCLPALALLTGEPRITRRIIRARAVQLWRYDSGGWRAIGRLAGMSHTKARLTHWGAMVSALASFREIPNNIGSAFPRRSRWA